MLDGATLDNIAVHSLSILFRHPCLHIICQDIWGKRVLPEEGKENGKSVLYVWVMLKSPHVFSGFTVNTVGAH